MAAPTGRYADGGLHKQRAEVRRPATLEEPLEWNNSTLIKGDVAEEITELKRQPGKDITIIGSGALVRSLLREGLLDELRLMVHPVVLGGGKRLFEDGGDRKALELVDSRTFGTGVLYLTYRPAGESAKKGVS